MDSFEQEQADREQYWAEMQRLKSELADASQDDEQEDDQ
jgi:hypothetical protein